MKFIHKTFFFLCNMKWSTNHWDTNGDSWVRKDTALTADFSSGSKANATVSVKRSNVLLASRHSFSSNSNVTTFTPAGTPRVSHEPIVSIDWISAVTDQSHCVVNINIFLWSASRENTRFVVREFGSINRHDNWSIVSNSPEQFILAVREELFVTLNSNFNTLLLRGECAVQWVTEVRVVRVLEFGSETENLRVSVSDFSSSTFATTWATTLVGVLNAADHLLGRESLQLTRVDGGNRFDGRDSSESPARTALTLIFNGWDDFSVSPVNVSREISQIGGWQISSRQVSERWFIRLHVLL